jgi:putative transposase
MAEHMRAELVVEALEMAIWQRRPETGLVHHSDRGGQPGLNWSSQQRVGAVKVSVTGDGRRHGGNADRGIAAVVVEVRP